MRAQPLYGDIYLQFREEDFGRKRLPGLVVRTEDTLSVFDDIDAALTYIRKLHDDNLKRKPE